MSFVVHGIPPFSGCDEAGRGPKFMLLKMRIHLGYREPFSSPP
jgi:hypothetical protein